MAGKLLFKITGSRKIKTIKDVDYLSGETITKFMYALILYMIIKIMFQELTDIFYWLFPKQVFDTELQYLFFV